MKLLGHGWKFGVIALGLAVLVLLVLDFNSRMAELRRLTAERERVSAQVTQLVETKEYLESQMAYATSEAAVAEWAYGNQMARPGENLVVPLPPPGSSPAPTPAPVVTPPVVSNWQVWLALFVDESAP